MSEQLYDLKVGEDNFDLTPYVRHIRNQARGRDKKLDQILKERGKEVKRHFRNKAWRLSLAILVEEVLDDYFKFDVRAYIESSLALAAKCRVQKSIDPSLILNVKPKVFYSPKKDKLYIDTSARNATLDVQLGNL